MQRRVLLARQFKRSSPPWPRGARCTGWHPWHGRYWIGAYTLLHLSLKTVGSYRSRLMHKLGLSNVPAVVRFAVRTGLVDANEP
jgi:hypothetical protein